MAKGKRADAPTKTNGHTEPETPTVGAQKAGDSAIELAKGTLLGDMRDGIIEQLRTYPESWGKLTEAQQKFMAQGIEDRCRRTIEMAVKILAADDRVTIAVQLEQVTFKPKGSDAKIAFLGLSRELKHALVDAQGSRVLIVVADATAYMGARRKPRIDKQEPALSLVEARDHGTEDGKGGNRSHEERYADGTPERKEYELAWNAAQAKAVEKTIKAPEPPAVAESEAAAAA